MTDKQKLKVWDNIVYMLKLFYLLGSIFCVPILTVISPGWGLALFFGLNWIVCQVGMWHWMKRAQIAEEKLEPHPHD